MLLTKFPVEVQAAWISAGLFPIPCGANKVPHGGTRWRDLILQSDKVKNHTLSLLKEVPFVGVEMGRPDTNLEAIDIDNKCDNAAEIYEAFCSTFDQYKNFWFAEQTPSGGYHIVYRAWSPKKNTKLAKQQGVAVVETRGVGGFIVTSPSEGYIQVSKNSLIDIATGSISSIDLQELFFGFSKAFDESASLEYNVEAQTGHDRVGDKLAELDTTSEMHDILVRHGWSHLYNVGSIQRYARPNQPVMNKVGGTLNAIPNKFFCFTSSTNLEPSKVYSYFQLYALLECNGDFKKAAKVLSNKHFSKDKQRKLEPRKEIVNEVTGEVTLEMTWKDCFFTSVTNAGIKVSVDLTGLLKYLQYEGYCRIELNERTVFVKVKDFVLYEEDPTKIVDCVLRQCENDRDYSDPFLKSIQKLRALSFIQSLPLREVEFLEDTVDTCYKVFANGVLVITKDKLEIKPLSELGKYVFDKTIIKNELILEDRRMDDFDDTHPFVRFLINVSSDAETKVLNVDRFFALTSSIGYLLHTYKNQALNKAIIFTEEFYDTAGQAHGRTGKSLIGKAIGQWAKTMSVDGKNFQADDRFKFSGYALGTTIAVVNDLRKNFDFESLFNYLSDDFEVNRKGQDAFTLPFEKSPKFLLTTNFTLNDDTASFKARKHEIEFSSWYSDTYSPAQDPQVGYLFGLEWDSKIWSGFYQAMAQCIGIFLANGLKDYAKINLDKRKMASAIPDELREYFEDFIGTEEHFHVYEGQAILKQEFYDRFKSRYPGFKNPRAQLINQKLGIYCDTVGINVDKEAVIKNKDLDDKLVRVFKFTSGRSKLSAVWKENDWDKESLFER